MNDDEFYKEVYKHSTLGMRHNSERVTTPETIRKYRQTMEANKAISIFDSNYDIDYEEDTLKSDLFLPVSNDSPFNDNEELTYVVSGRGRGGGNRFFKPGNSRSDISNDEEIRNQIRKIHGIGYSNEITEASIRAHQLNEEAKQKEAAKKKYSNGERQLFQDAVEPNHTMLPALEDTQKSSIKDGAKPKNSNLTTAKCDKSLPLSEILKRSREELKTRKRDRKKNTNDGEIQKMTEDNTKKFIIDKNGEKPELDIASEKQFPSLL